MHENLTLGFSGNLIKTVSTLLLGNTAHGKGDPCLVNDLWSERTIGPWQEVTSLDFLRAVTLVIAVSLTETLEAIPVVTRDTGSCGE